MKGMIYMKIAVIVPSNLINAPYYYLYENLLKSNNNLTFDLIYWNRLLTNDSCSTNMIPFNCKDQVNSGNPLKLFKYIRFSSFIVKQIRKNKYDRIIILGSNGGVMALLSNYLEKHFKHRYWLDIRDYTYENFKPYYKMIKKSIMNSFNTAISSKKYETFLPKYDYSIVHNIDLININKSIESRKNLIKSDKIRISYIGLNGYFDYQKKLVDIFANDDRFILQFYGLNSEIIKDYCEKNHVQNVDFYGKFDSNKTAEFYQKTDIINNIYGNDRLALTTALSNKLYFSLALNIPILVCKNTYMEEVTKEAGNGFVIDFDSKTNPDDLYKWYHKTFLKEKNKCNIIFNNMVKENEQFIQQFKKFIA